MGTLASGTQGLAPGASVLVGVTTWRTSSLAVTQLKAGLSPDQGLSHSAVSEGALPGGVMSQALLAVTPRADDLPIPGEPAAAQAYGPLIAHSMVPGTNVTIVASRGSKTEARRVHALRQERGKLVTWVRLPFTQLPEAAFVLDGQRTLYLCPAQGGKTDIVLLDHSGTEIVRQSLEALLPPGVRRSEVPASLMPTPTGASLGVPLLSGSMALVELGVDHRPGTSPSEFEVCSVILSDKYACGVEAWLEQARQLDRAGDAEAARFALDAAIETDPMDARGYRELAHFYRRQDLTAQQLNTLRTGVTRLHAKVLGVADDDWQVGTPAARLTLDYLNAARATDDPELVTDVMDLALRLYPCMEQLVLTRAEFWIGEGETTKAIDSIRAALGQVDPNGDLAAAHHDAGRFLRRKGLTEAALHFCEDAYALGDHSEFLLRGLADISVELNKPERAVEWLSLLAERWRSELESVSDGTRNERAQSRLRVLEEEIAALQSDVESSR
ncbi:hypothetical protein [Planctomycetes bacterium Poly30]|uniref:tetratricopeptide repeat protein n=1 Tax=Saltatorellus ferox TaxID=2528018 RepID=UPI0011A30D73